jgi:hypothetical protein
MKTKSIRSNTAETIRAILLGVILTAGFTSGAHAGSIWDTLTQSSAQGERHVNTPASVAAVRG